MGDREDSLKELKELAINTFCGVSVDESDLDVIGAIVSAASGMALKLRDFETRDATRESLLEAFDASLDGVDTDMDPDNVGDTIDYWINFDSSYEAQAEYSENSDAYDTIFGLSLNLHETKGNVR